MSLRVLRLAGAAALAGALATGCGFRPRTAEAIPTVLQTIYLSSQVSSTDNGDLIRWLRRTLESNGSQVVDDPNSAVATLLILTGGRLSRILTYNYRDRPQEYEVAYTVQFSLTAGATVLIPTERLTLTRHYNYRISNAIGNEEQEEALYKSMQKDMAQLILLRIQAAARTYAQTLPPPPATHPGATSVAPPATPPRP